MGDAIWPAGLPQAPQVAAYSQTQPDLVARTQMSVGPAKVRRRTTAGVEVCQIQLKLTRLQVALLKTFFLDTVEGGALTFEWKHHETGNPIDYRFVGPPTERPLSPRLGGSEYWVAEFTLEAMPATEVIGVRPPPPPPPPEEEILEFLYGAAEPGGGGDDQVLDGFASEPQDDTSTPMADDGSLVFSLEDAMAPAPEEHFIGSDEAGAPSNGPNFNAGLGGGV